MTPVFEIWIASHFHSQQRFEWFKEAIKSIRQQTLAPDLVYISWSKESYVTGDPVSLKRNLNLISFPQPKRMTQFEHLRYIFDHSQGRTNNTFILFCDDDDMYHPLRVEKIRDYLIANPLVKVGRDNSLMITGSATLKNLGETVSIHFDFGNYVVRADVMKQFFDLFIPGDIPESYVGLADCAFTGWLESMRLVHSINQELYYRRYEMDVLMYRCWAVPIDYDFESDRISRQLDIVTYGADDD